MISQNAVHTSPRLAAIARPIASAPLQRARSAVGQRPYQSDRINLTVVSAARPDAPKFKVRTALRAAKFLDVGSKQTALSHIVNHDLAHLTEHDFVDAAESVMQEIKSLPAPERTTVLRNVAKLFRPGRHEITPQLYSLLCSASGKLTPQQRSIIGEIAVPKQFYRDHA